MIEKKTTKEILKTAYFNGFNVVLRDETEINKFWVLEETLKKDIEDRLKENQEDSLWIDWNKGYKCALESLKNDLFGISEEQKDVKK